MVGSNPDATATLGIQLSVIYTGAISIDGDALVVVVYPSGVVLTGR